jgi:hypothetical protein
MTGVIAMRYTTLIVLLAVAGCRDKMKVAAPTSATTTAGSTVMPTSATTPASGAAPAAKTDAGVSAAVMSVDVTHDPTTVNDVTFSDNTVMIDVPTFKNALAGAWSNGQVLVLENIPEVTKLQPGSVLLVKGVAMRKVLAVMPFEGKTALLLTDAAITDAIKHGHVHVEHGVSLDASALLPPSVTPNQPRFEVAGLGLGLDPLLHLLQGSGQGGGPDGAGQASAMLQQKLSDLTSKISTQADSANGGLSKCGTFQTNWNYCVGGSRGASRINLTLTVSRDYHGFIGKIQGTGYIQDFQMATDLDVDDSKLSSFTLDTKNANGLLNLQFTGAKENKDPLSKEEFDQAIPLPGNFELTYLVGPLPLTIKVDEALIVRPGFSGMNQIVEFNGRLTYNSTQHLSLRPGNINDDGDVSGVMENLQTNTMLTGPYGFVVAMAAPQVEVGFDASSAWKGLTSLVPDKVVELGKKAAEAFENWGPVKQLLDGPLGPQIQQALDITEKAVTTVLKTKAAVKFNFVTSVGVLSAGMVTMIPCQKTTEMVTANISADAALFGMNPKDTLKKELFKKVWEQGPVSGPCAMDKQGSGP